MIKIWKKLLDLTISGKKSNLLSSDHDEKCSLLVIGHILTVDVIGLVWKLVGGMQKHLFL